MKVLVLLLLAVVPLAMAAGHGDFEKMMKAMKEEEEHAKDGHKEEDCDKDHDDEEEMKKMMKELGMEMGQWREKMAEWLKKDGDDDHDSGEKDSDEKDDDEKPDPEKEKKKKEMYMEFYKFLKYKAEEKEAKEKKMEEFKKEVHQFQDYKKFQKMQHKMEMKKEMKKEQMKEFEEASHQLREKYMYLSHEYTQAKFYFKYSITNQVLDICQCDGRKSLMKRLHDGEFGKPDMRNNSGNGNATQSSPPPSTGFPGSSTSFSPAPNGTSRSPPPSTGFPGSSTSFSPAPNGTSRSPPPQQSSSSTDKNPGSSGSVPPATTPTSVIFANGKSSSSFPNGTTPPFGSQPTPTPTFPDDGEDDDDGKSREEMMDIVRKFAMMNPEEQFEYAFHRLSKSLCGAAAVYMEHVMDLEEALIEYKQMYYGGSNATTNH